MNDLRFALRQLRKSPGFTLVAVVTLALGIGANTALFSAFNRFVLHPLTLPRADRLVRLWVSNPAMNYSIPYVSWPRYEFICDHQKSFSNISAANFASYALTRNGADPEQLNALQVTTSFFPTLGIMPLHGRNFTNEEDSVGGANVAIISYECWHRYFGGRDSIVGESIVLSGASYVIVGVLTPTISQAFNNVVIFVPAVSEPQDIATEQEQNGAGFLNVTARLRDGVTFGQATAEMRILSENYNAAFSDHVDGKYDSLTKTFAEELVGNFRSTFHLLLAAVGFVLLIACANVASLFLGRLSTRRKEIAVRLALGATRGQLVRQFLTESIVFSVAAGLLGVLLGCWALDLIQEIVGGATGKSGVAGIVGTNPLPGGTPLGLDGATLAFTIAVSVLSALLVGWLPALVASRPGAGDALQQPPRGAAAGVRGGRGRWGPFVGEVALSVVVLVGSALLFVILVHLHRTQPGFERRGVPTAFINIPRPRYATEWQ